MTNEGVGMAWAIGALIVVGILTLGALVFLKRRDPDRDADVDPLFVAGISISGAGAALIATLGASALAMIVVGLALLVIGTMRSRRGAG